MRSLVLLLTSSLMLLMLAACTNDSDSSTNGSTTFITPTQPTETSESTEPNVEPPLMYQNPVFEPVFADPSVIRADDGTFYAYGTSDYGEWNGEIGTRLIPILQSEDLVNWEYAGSVFNSSNRPTWRPTSFGIWAPDIVKIGDTYNLYYSFAGWEDEINSAVGVATSKHPEGPWVDQGAVVTTQNTGVKQSIDSYVFEYEDGVYMIWGSYYGMFYIELSSDGLTIKEGAEPVQIGGRRDFSTYEGAWMIEKDDYYYLFTSHGNCCEGLATNYYVNVARATSPFGPYYGADDVPLLGSGLGSLVIRGNAWFVGTGHNSVIQDDAGEFWILYHGYDTSKEGKFHGTNRRALLIDKLLWTEDGWPYVEKYGASHRETEAPYIEKQ